MATGTRFSYTDTGNVKRTIADVVNMLEPFEAALLRIFGFSRSNVNKFKLVNWPNTKAELLEDTVPVLESTLTEALDGTEVDWDVADGTLFRQGDIVAVMLSGQVAEKGLVTVVVSNTLTVAARGYGDTSATTHSSGATVKIVGRAMPEGADYTTGYSTLTTQPFNYTQIISQAAKVTKTNAEMLRYGIDNEMDYQVMKLFNDDGTAGELAKKLQQIWYYGEKVQRDASNYGSAGGFETFVTTNVLDLNGAAIQRDHIHTKIRQIRTAGGRCTHLVTGAWGMEKLTAMYEDAIRTERDETLGGSEIQSILTPHGKVKLVYDWMCPEDRYYFVNEGKVGWIPFRDFDATDIKEQGDYFVRDVVGEFTFLVCNEKSHGIIKEASVSS